ncbi:MAG: PaaI family thioesterase [Weeksellaceae bacterium]
MINKEAILAKLNEMNQHTMMEWMQVKYIDFTGDTLTVEMPVNERVHQPYGLLHGGATAALAETVGSVLSAAQFSDNKMGAVGTNLNIYHLKSARQGKVFAKGSFIRKGNSLHVIRIDIYDENENAISYAILTTKIIDIAQKSKRD